MGLFEPHFILFCFLFITFLFNIVFDFIFLIHPLNLEIEKLSSYECGFHSFEDTRIQFNIRFYLVSIIFIIFDLEVVYCFLFINVLRLLGFSARFSILVFLVILIIGFIYEWVRGALVWE